MHDKIRIDDEVFISDGTGAVGAVREISSSSRPELVVYFENAGDFTVPLTAVDAVHSGKVILRCSSLEPRLRKAIGHAHDAETPR